MEQAASIPPPAGRSEGSFPARMAAPPYVPSPVTAPLQEWSSMCPTPRTTARSRCCGLGANGVSCSRFRRKKGYSRGGEAGPSGSGHGVPGSP